MSDERNNVGDEDLERNAAGDEDLDVEGHSGRRDLERKNVGDEDASATTWATRIFRSDAQTDVTPRRGGEAARRRS